MDKRTGKNNPNADEKILTEKPPAFSNTFLRNLHFFTALFLIATLVVLLAYISSKNRKMIHTLNESVNAKADRSLLEEKVKDLEERIRSLESRKTK